MVFAVNNEVNSKRGNVFPVKYFLNIQYFSVCTLL